MNFERNYVYYSVASSEPSSSSELNAGDE